MCGIGLILFPDYVNPALFTTVDGQSSTPQSKPSQKIDNRSTSSGSQSSSSDNDASFCALEKCLMEGIAPRGPDLPYSRRQHRVHFSKQTIYCDDSTRDKKCMVPKDINECGDDEKIHLIMRVALPNRAKDGDTASSTLDWTLNLYASVLHMRGRAITPQPYVIEGSDEQIDEYDYAFCWNGECYSYKSDEDEEKDIDEYESDTKFVMQILKESIQKSREINYDNPSTAQRLKTETGECDNQRTTTDRRREHLAIAQGLGRVRGEYSFILHCGPRCHTDEGTDSDECHLKEDGSGVIDQIGDKGRIYFGRDPMGRRSLLMTKVVETSTHRDEVDEGKPKTELTDNLSYTTDNLPVISSFIIASVALTSHRWERDCSPLETKPETHTFSDDEKEELNKITELEEIIAGRVYCLDLNSGTISSTFIPLSFDRTVTSSTQIVNQKTILDKATDSNSNSNSNSNMNLPTSIIDAADRLYFLLDRAVRRRVINAPKPRKRCQDATTVTTNTIEKIEEEASVAILFSGGVDSVVLAALCQNHIPEGQPIDLINVAFASSSSTVQERNRAYASSPDRQAALVSYYEMKVRWPNRDWRFIAVNVDYSEVLEYEKLICGLVAPRSSTMDFNVGTAFFFASRGRGLKEERCGVETKSMIDSEHLRFATSNRKKIIDGQGSNIISHQTHSKKVNCSMRDCKKFTQHGCVFGACKFCCSSYQKPINKFLQRSGRICPLHNADKKMKSKSRGKVQSNSPNDTVAVGTDIISDTIISNAQVVLIGIGADEQMAGYARHRSTYERGGYGALRAELQMEKDRLWTRNLGRDDRCVSYHGKEARFPFLDEDVVDYLNCLDVLHICDMTKPQGEGDKMILRLVAKKIGVHQCSGLVKRAIQFGSRIAKVSDVDRFGSSRKASGTAQHRKGSS